MGTISHDALIVMGYGDSNEKYDTIKKAHELALEVAARFDATEVGRPMRDVWANLVSPILYSHTNGYASFYVAPDGSKEWWDTSERGDEFRSEIASVLGDGVTVVQVRWGELGMRISDGYDAVERIER